MKICWGMLESFWLTTEGNFKKGNGTIYIEMDSCKVCGNSYLTNKHRVSLFCSTSCARSGENNHRYGKSLTAKTKKKIAKASIGYVGHLSHNYRGGVCESGLTIYDTYKDRLELYEDIRKQEDTEILEAKCVYCGKWHQPTRNSVTIRLAAINSLTKGECRLYCSENCKQACPTYHRQKYPKGFKHTTSREVSSYLRKMVLERDNWTCQICGKTINEAQLHVHHMDPVSWNPMFQNDMDSCITLCKGCHKMVHSRIGCRYIDLVCKKVG